MKNDMIRAGIVGGAGYTGGEMLRILIRHPNIELVFVHSRSNAGRPISDVHTDLYGETDIAFNSDITHDVDVILLCVGHGEAGKWLSENIVDDKVKIIDLSHDHRLHNNAINGNREFVYGLPEAKKDQIVTAQNIANPGCFATCIQLGLLPLAANQLLSEIHTTGITGSTGAGQKLSATSHFAWRTNNIQAYKTLQHQHVLEITETLKSKQNSFSELNFVPIRGDFARGIYVTSYTKTDLSLGDANKLYSEYYAAHPFTHVSAAPIHMKQVVNTNKCLVYLEKVGDKLVVHTAIDNLTKGASGQAVQNMNLMFGLPESAGLDLKAPLF